MRGDRVGTVAIPVPDIRSVPDGVDIAGGDIIGRAVLAGFVGTALADFRSVPDADRADHRCAEFIVGRVAQPTLGRPTSGQRVVGTSSTAASVSGSAVSSAGSTGVSSTGTSLGTGTPSGTATGTASPTTALATFTPDQWIAVVGTWPIDDVNAFDRAEQWARDLTTAGIGAQVLLDSSYPDLQLIPGVPPAKHSYMVYLGPFASQAAGPAGVPGAHGHSGLPAGAPQPERPLTTAFGRWPAFRASSRPGGQPAAQGRASSRTSESATTLIG